MSLPKINPTKTTSWTKLQEHFKEIENVHMKGLFATDPKRAETFTIKWEDFYVDFSKNRITTETIKLLIELANEVDLKNAISKYFGGEAINQTENRAVLHTALRAKKSDTVIVGGTNVIPEGRLVLGYRNCVNCSTTELYSYIPIIGNKQVLELQIVSQELSAAVHKSWRRK